MKKKGITNEDLATMMQREFLAIHKKMDTKFEKVDKRFEQVDKKLKDLDNSLTEVKNKVNQIDRRLFSVEEDVAEIKIKQYGELSKRVSFIEKKLGIVGWK